MPTKRIFDLFILMFAFAVPAFGLVRLESRRLAAEKTGVVRDIGVAGSIL